jgi:integrase
VNGNRTSTGNRQSGVMLPTLGRPRDPARQAPGDAALVLGNLDATHRHPERYSRRFVDQVVQARRALGEDQLPKIRLHDLRHTHAALLLAAGEPVKVVSERIGHASATITLSVYQHVHPGVGRQAADRLAALLRG